MLKTQDLQFTFYTSANTFYTLVHVYATEKVVGLIIPQPDIHMLYHLLTSKDTSFLNYRTTDDLQSII